MRFTVTLLILFGLLACNDEPIIPPGNNDTSAGDVLVINEGGFQRGNGSLGLYNLSTNVYSDKIYQGINGAFIGDVVQSITTHQGEYWVVINNSGKIVVLDSASLKTKIEIKGFKSPRYVTFSSNGEKAFVSDLYANELSVVSTNTYAITNHIALDGWSDQMAVIGDHVYVANREHPYVYLVNQVSEIIEDSIEIAHNPNALLRLRNGYLAVLCEGRLGSSDIPQYQIIHPDTKTVLFDGRFEPGEKPSLLRQSPITGNIYCAFKGIYYIHPVNYTNQGKIIDLPEANIYGFDIDPSNGNIFIADAVDYVKKSEVSVYLNGNKFKHKFTAGVICNGFVFR
ncbi:MAG: DNA-binding beta-propeller fold protein YncE [Bacteroidia bacterium]|jgi:DNA-binding beta-propeller fold protein YncE